MAECDVCKILEKKDSFLTIYEDDKCLAILHEVPAAAGHAMVFPKEHKAILEDMPDDILGHVFTVANVISSTIFDTLGAMGTNILVNNGVSAGQELPHFMVHVIPRKEGDNINLEWVPKQKSQEELEVIKNMITSGPKKPEPQPVQQSIPEPVPEHGDEMTKRLKRIP